MITMSSRHEPMKAFRAIYKEPSEKRFTLDILAPNMAKATLAATELMSRNSILVSICHNPDW